MNILIGSLESIGIPIRMQQDWTDEYQKPHRFYHNLNHIRHMLETFTNHCGNMTKGVSEIIAAIWLHDIVYDPKAHDNEERSAEVARRDLLKCVTDLGEKTDLSIPLVMELILSTKTHRKGLPLIDLFCDLDLFILAEKKDVYTQYLTNIRREYSFVPLEIYTFERTKILQKIR